MTGKPTLYFDEMESPMGAVTIVATEKGICKLHFGDSESALPLLSAWSKKVFYSVELVRNADMLFGAENQLTDYFAGTRKEFQLPLDFQGTPFQKKVWQELLRIEYGETRSYKDIATAVNAPRAVRAVGNAVNRNPLPIIIPCHRIIGSNGELVGYNGGLEKKQQLLQIEDALEKIS